MRRRLNVYLMLLVCCGTLLLAGCGGAEGEGTEEGTPVTAASLESLGDDALRMAALADTVLDLSPMEVPAADFAQASEEQEPNEKPAEATPLGPNRTGRGTLEGREDDLFAFEAEGEPQFWYIEATGEGIAEMWYQDTAGNRSNGKPTAGEAGRFTIANVFLLPGTHYIGLRNRSGPGGDYTVRAVPLGPPDPQMEQEANDDESRAMPLRFGMPRKGLLFEPKDEDLYHFTLTVETNVTLRFMPPPGIVHGLQLYARGRSKVVVEEREADAGPFTRTLRLVPGEYFLNVYARDERSDTPYGLWLNYADSFNLPDDLEPNNSLAEAAPLPPDFVVEGTPVTGREDDYYRLPPLSAGTMVTVTSDKEITYAEQGGVSVYPEDNDSGGGLLRYDKEANHWQGEIPSDGNYVAWIRAAVPYTYTFAFSPGPQPDASGPPTVAVELPEGPLAVAAYLEETQRVRVPVTLRNTGNSEQALMLEARTSHPGWIASVAAPSVTIGSGETKTVPITITVAPDASDLHAVELAVGARGPGGAVGGRTSFLAVCGVQPVNPVHIWPLPESILGGVNVALTEFGAVPVDAERTAVYLMDGRAPYTSAWTPYLKNAQVVIDLAGDAPVQIGGVALNPRTSREMGQRIHDFTIAVSTNGQTFTDVLTDRLGAQAEEQVFAFEAPVEATHIRFTGLSTHNLAQYWATLGELKVIAMPGSQPLGASGFNLADPDRGGYVVWSDPLIPRQPQTLLTEEADARFRRLDIANPNQWVVGFLHDRAAQITHLEWVQPAEANYALMKDVKLAVSQHPTGPWTALGTWTLDATVGSTSRFDLPADTWARYVRFTHTEAQDQNKYWQDPETIRIFERPADETYRSILGEWGHYAKDAVYEFLEGKATRQGEAEADNNDNRSQAQRITLGSTYQGQVLVNEDEDWYRIAIPSGDNRLMLDLRGDPSLRARYRLLDSNEEVIPLEEAQHPEDGRPMLEAFVEPGGTYYLHLEEPPRSVAFVWDNSASVQPYAPIIYRTMAQFAEGLEPGREEGNLLPLGAKDYLLDEWATHPYTLQQTMNNYDRHHASSNAEEGLLVATKGLREREGTKAVVLIADAITGSYNQTAELWQALGDVQPRVFTLEMQGGQSTLYHQHLMQSWASAGGGIYDHFGSNEDLEVGFARASCLIRRPAGYTLVAETRHEEPPEPGTLFVSLEEAAVSGAVELILDASGSMLQRLNGKQRIAIARDVLTDLVQNTLPEGTPLALRIFGHRTPDACETDLEVPLAPLNRQQVTQRIRNTEAKNLAKTPIGASLGLVAEDLNNADGQKIVILITDGEETCDGDPTAAIQALKDAGLDVRVNIVGFAIDDEGLKAEFDRWATSGGGRYFDASGEEELSESVKQALRPKFQVLNAAGEVLQSGTVGDEAVELPVGTYTVKVLTSPPQTFENVQITSEQQTDVTAGATTAQNAEG